MLSLITDLSSSFLTKQSKKTSTHFTLFSKTSTKHQLLCPALSNVSALYVCFWKHILNGHGLCVCGGFFSVWTLDISKICRRWWNLVSPNEIRWEVVTIHCIKCSPETMYFISGAYLLGSVLYQEKRISCTAGVTIERSLSSVSDKWINWLRSIKLSTVFSLEWALWFLLNYVEQDIVNWTVKWLGLR